MSPYPTGSESGDDIPIAGALFDKGGGFYNLMHPDFGGVGNGTNDDGAAINTALLAISAAGGGVLLIPPGTYDLATAVSWAGYTNVQIWLLPGVSFTTNSLTAATGLNNSIRDFSSGGQDFNQGDSDDDILVFRSSDIAHALTSVAPTDAFMTFKKGNAGFGGVLVEALAEDSAFGVPLNFNVFGGTANTSKNVGASGLFKIEAYEHDGAGAFANITANGNLFAVSGQVGGGQQTAFLVDEDGDYHYNGADGGAFDEYDDSALVRTLMRVTSTKGLIKSHWDRMVRYNEQDLIAAGILGDTLENGGLINAAQLNRLLLGAVWQLQSQINELRLPWYKRLYLALRGKI